MSTSSDDAQPPYVGTDVGTDVGNSAPAYPPHPDVYRQPAGQWPAAGPPPDLEGAAPGWRCQWCGRVNAPGAGTCATCHALAPVPGAPPLWLASPPGQPGAPAYPPYPPSLPYPPYAPDGSRPALTPEMLRPPTPPAPRASGRATRAGTAVGITATAVAVLSKVGVLAKVALPLLSAVASLGVYALIFGWQFGLGIVVLLFIHEMGHVVAIRSKGLPASLPIFIPLLGAAVLMRRMPQSAEDEAEIAIAGPLAGAVAAIACYFVYAGTSSHLWLALAYFSFLINLINLVPVSPLDGGRVVGAISRWVWPLGLVAVAVLLYYTHNILLILIAWLGLMQTLAAFRQSEATARYYRVPLATRLSITLLYLGLAALLAVGTLQTQQALAASANPFFLGR